MNEKNKCFTIAIVSAAVGGALGAVSGSSSWIVVGIVSAVFGGVAAWSLYGLVK